MKNWKTTLAGVIVAGVTFATYMGWITVEIGGAILGLAVAIGLGVAKDSDVSGN